MEVFGRTKRVTDPLDDKVRASICGDHHDHQLKSYVSSGSEHEADDNNNNSPCLSHLIHEFLERENQNHNDNNDNDDNDHHQLNEDDYLSDSDINISKFLSLTEPIDLIQDLLNPKRNSSSSDSSFRFYLQSQVSKAMNLFSCFRSNREIFRRKIMIFLRELGYNAGICKTKWEKSKSGGLSAGNYEFIDVIIKSDESSVINQRYFIDTDFSDEFEIARPTSQYEKLLKILPRVYIGKSEELKQIVKMISEAAKRSLKSRDLYLSPWRKNRYMQMKWFGPYRRTVGQIPASMSSLLPPSSSSLGFDQFPAKCQSIGFKVVVTNSSHYNGFTNGSSNGRFIISAATRTR